MRLRFWRSNPASHCSPPLIPRCVVSPRRFLTLASPSAVLAHCLQLTLFTPHRFCSLVSLSPSLSLCFSFATLCTRVKTTFLCLRAVMMRDTYSFFAYRFPCLFVVSLGSFVPCWSATQSPVYMSNLLLDFLCTVAIGCTRACHP